MALFYGRRTDLSKLDQTFDQVQKGHGRAVLVSGPAGSGKTALVTRFAVDAEAAGAMFARGKASALHQNTPFATITAALNMLVKKLITDDPGAGDKMVETFKKAGGDKGLNRILTLVPALSYLFYARQIPDDSPETLKDLDANFLLFSFLETVSTLSANGLILFFDDLQWLDRASHGFLRYFAINGFLSRTLVILSFRSGKAENNHNLQQTVRAFKHPETARTVTLSGLTRRDTAGFFKQRLETDQSLGPLADVCHEKTAGNPFYLTRMLDELLEKKWIYQKNSEWVYDLSQIQGLGFTDNVADLIIKRIRVLEKESISLLKQAACIQTDISIPLLQATSGFPREKIETLLWKPVQHNLLQKNHDGFVFTHDKILESVETMLTESESKKTHRRLVAFYTAEDQKSGLENNIFTLLYHYGFYSQSEKDPSVREKMSGLYFVAGKKAINQTSYHLALAYFSQGKAHYPGDIWAEDYGLALKFGRKLAGCAYLAGDFAAADRIFGEVKERARSFSDRFEVEMVKIPCYNAQERTEKALETGLTNLRRLGVKIPRNPSDPLILYTVFKTWFRLITTSQKRLEQKRLDPGSDVYKAVECLNALGGIAYHLSPVKLLPMITAVAFHLILKHGNMKDAPIIYIGFGIILNSMTGTVRWGKRLGETARQVGRHFGNSRFKPKEVTLTNIFLDHWGKPMEHFIRGFSEAEKMCLRQGEHEFFAYNALVRLHWLMIGSKPLEMVRQEIEEKTRVLERINDRFSLTIAGFMKQAVANLEKGVDKPWILTGDYFDEDRLDSQINGILTDFYFYKFCMAFYCGRSDIAHEIKKIPGVFDITLEPYKRSIFHFYSAFVDIRQNCDAKTIRNHLKRLKKYSQYNKAIYGNKYLLALGESMRTKKEPGAAAVYRDAMAAAQIYGFRFEQALACEGLWMIAKENGDDKAAQAHFDEAVNLYREWGLKWRYPLFEHGSKKSRAPETVMTVQQLQPASILAGPEVENRGPAIDKAVDDILLAMKTMTGATAVHAVVQVAQTWKSCVYINDNGICRPLSFVRLPEKMLGFACATGELIEVGEQSIEEQFLDTAYFFKHRPSSLMVFPDGLHKAVYIENLDKAQDTKKLQGLAKELLSFFEPEPAASGPGFQEKADLLRHRDNCTRLQEYMEQYKLYRNPNLTITDIAKETGVSERAITDAINTCLGQNFRTFVNSYRIEAVKKALLDPGEENKTILEIAFSLGFNSKSTFNDLFKRVVGVTPSKFRKQTD